MNPASPSNTFQDILLPDPISFWPLAWPWWALMIALAAIIIFSIYYYQKNQWRRQAIKQLKDISTQDHLLCIQQCNRLLKQVALYRFGKISAPLSAEKWLDFLDEKVKKPIFKNELHAFAFAPDQPSHMSTSIDINQLKKAIESWIRKHTC